MTDSELIIFQAKQLVEQANTIDYYRGRCALLEAQMRVKDNITESNDDLPLDMTGMANRMKMGDTK